MIKYPALAFAAIAVIGLVLGAISLVQGYLGASVINFLLAFYGAFFARKYARKGVDKTQ